MAGIANHAQLGLNETPITSALEKGDFNTAEKLIQENTEPGYLDEGAFQVTPLTQVLSSSTEVRAFPRHLRLARLLVECGANPNLHVPHSEWRPSPSPMEYLWDLYTLTRDQLSGVKDVGSEHEDLPVDPLFTIGLHDETELTLLQLQEQILELLDIFLAFGGDANIRTTRANSTLYHVALADPNVQETVIMKLSEAGGDPNLKNVHGTTALMDLITYSHGDQALHILRQIWQRTPQVLSLNDVNCSNESALWRAMFSGSPGVGQELLSRGAILSERVYVMMSSCGRKKFADARMSYCELSAIMSPLLQDSAPYAKHMVARTGSVLHDSNAKTQPFHVSLLEKVISCAISPVVDNTAASECFPPAVLEEISSVCTLGTAFPFDSLLTLSIQPQDVAMLMFGKLGAGLQQLCVNRILEYVFFTREPRESWKLINRLKPEVPDPESPPEDNWEQLDAVMALSAPSVDRLVTELKLPPSLAPRFQVAAARLQLGAMLYTFESSWCRQGCEADSDESSWDPLIDDFENDIYDDTNDVDEDDYDSDEFMFSSEIEFEGEEEEEYDDGVDDDDGVDEAEENCMDKEESSVEEWKIDVDSNSEEIDGSDNLLSEVESGESVPDIKRDDYEAFGREASDDSASSDDAMCN